MYKSIHTRHNEVFLALLRDRREAMGLRQADLAEKIGQTQAMVSRVERGERRLDVIELRAWLSALDLKLVTFMRRLEDRLRQANLYEIRLGQEAPIRREQR
jgi:transcriptional regulator with XRE-family HTH domain